MKLSAVKNIFLTSPHIAQKCEIRKESSGKLVGTTARTSNNIYVLSEIGNEKCYLGKEDES
jgi:hypothetical protein